MIKTVTEIPKITKLLTSPISLLMLWGITLFSIVAPDSLSNVFQLVFALIPEIFWNYINSISIEFSYIKGLYELLIFFQMLSIIIFMIGWGLNHNFEVVSSFLLIITMPNIYITHAVWIVEQLHINPNFIMQLNDLFLYEAMSILGKVISVILFIGQFYSKKKTEI